ncbi:MAG: ribokinase [Eubacteriales bacterium]|nr:ribokinase [Eubacteriales bacterium]
MKVLNFGSLNIDRVYNVTHHVLPGETITAADLNTYAGGKGLNQSIALGRAGAETVHIGAIGEDGDFLLELLTGAGVDTHLVRRIGGSSGHAIIQVSPDGQNSIVIFGGANRTFTEEYVRECLTQADKGDYVLLQNETNEISAVITEAAKRGAKVVFNPSPITEDILSLPLKNVSLFMVNEIEGAQLAGMSPDDEPRDILDTLSVRYPNADIVLTLGSRGVICKVGGEVFSQPIFRVTPVDTTAAGDTFCGYFLACRCKGMSVPDTLRFASAASAITVSRAGAAPSIPAWYETTAFLSES